jgi:PIN domain nuclease of toxin-antitoxin system
MTQQLQINEIDILPITIGHTAAVITLPFHHKDPFDRLLIAQSLTETMPIVSADSALSAYGVSRLW